MGFRFERRARSRKARTGIRSWFGGAPDAREVAERLRRLLPRLWKDAEITGSATRHSVALHRFAPPLRIAVETDAAIAVEAEAGGLGPGYCEEIEARLAAVLDELDYAWDPAPAPRDAMLAWLAGELAAGATRIAMPEDRRFVVDAPIQTAMGPRDAAWRDAVLADPGAGADAFAWGERGPGRRERSSALLAMWHEVPWREPIDKAELALMKRVDGELAAAHQADPALALPYAEWAELVGYLGEAGDAERAAELAGRATGPAVIGYRRYDMALEIAGWSLTLPGSFVGRWEDGGERYWATDGDRMVELSHFETTEHDPDKLIDVAPPLHPVVDRLSDGERRGRAEAYDEDAVRIVHGLIAVAPHVAILTCKGKPRDEPWALATWRSLRR